MTAAVARRHFPPEPLFALVLLLTLALTLPAHTGLVPLPATIATPPTPLTPPLAFAEPLANTGPATVLETRGPAGRLRFTPSGVRLDLPGGALLGVTFLGASVAALRGAEPLPGVVHQLHGADPADWRTGLPTYGAVAYGALYRGIDLRYEGREGALRGTFTVAPHVDPAPLRWRYDGVQTLAIEPASGDLQITLAGGRTLVERAPVAWQDTPAGRVPVAARFALLDSQRHEVGFALGVYDPAMPLVIDPSLEYSGYLGGSNTETTYDVAVDALGNAYIVGDTISSDFPTLAPIQGPSTLATTDVFLTKLNPQGQRVFSTYLGGSGSDSGLAIALDPQGNIYLTGVTSSADFPTRAPFQGERRGSADAFVVKLNPSGSAILYSTYFGGSAVENLPAGAAGIAVSAEGGAVITGLTGSADLPTAAAFQPALRGATDAFVAAFSPDGQTLAFATYLGGELDERPRDLALSGAGAVYITGYTTSTEFPTKSAFQPQSASPGDQDAFVTRLSPEGALLASTYLGGAGVDEGLAITVDSTGAAYVTGTHGQNGFPRAGAINGIGGPGGSFLTRLGPDGTTAPLSVWFGDSARTVATDLVFDPTGGLIIAGQTDSPSFPTRNAVQATLGGASDTFVLRLDPQLCSVVAGSYFGGAGSEGNVSVAVDGQGDIILAGATTSSNLPLQDAQQGRLAGGADAFTARLRLNGEANCQSRLIYIPLVRR